MNWLIGNQLHQILSGPIMTATLALPPLVASSLLQQHITAAFQGQAQAATLGELLSIFIRYKCWLLSIVLL
jgi:hypothetical protein